MRLKLTGQARSARHAAEQLGIPTATTALKRFLGVINRKPELVRAYFAFKSVENIAIAGASSLAVRRGSC